MSKQTTLAAGQITPSTHDTITVELTERGDLPALVKITWPLHPTVVDQKSFGDLAVAVVKLFSSAHVALAAIKVWKKL